MYPPCSLCPLTNMYTMICYITVMFYISYKHKKYIAWGTKPWIHAASELTSLTIAQRLQSTAVISYLVLAVSCKDGTTKRPVLHPSFAGLFILFILRCGLLCLTAALPQYSSVARKAHLISFHSFIQGNSFSALYMTRFIGPFIPVNIFSCPSWPRNHKIQKM